MLAVTCSSDLQLAGSLRACSNNSEGLKVNVSLVLSKITPKSFDWLVLSITTNLELEETCGSGGAELKLSSTFVLAAIVN